MNKNGELIDGIIGLQSIYTNRYILSNLVYALPKHFLTLIAFSCFMVSIITLPNVGSELALILAGTYIFLASFIIYFISIGEGNFSTLINLIDRDIKGDDNLLAKFIVKSCLIGVKLNKDEELNKQNIYDCMLFFFKRHEFYKDKDFLYFAHSLKKKGFDNMSPIEKELATLISMRTLIFSTEEELELYDYIFKEDNFLIINEMIEESLKGYKITMFARDSDIVSKIIKSVQFNVDKEHQLEYSEKLKIIQGM